MCSSFSVYNYSATRRTLDEDSPLHEVQDVYTRDGYTIAKWWQERVTRRYAETHGWDLTVLRPGFIWGRDHGYLVWGEGNAGTAATAPGGWTRLTAARIGALWVPCEAGAKRRVELTAREYFERQAFGNVAFVRERLRGLREMPADADKASNGRQG